MRSRVPVPKRARPKADAPPPQPAVEGLTPLDRERAASVADEGGATAAGVESQEPPEK